MKNTDLKTLVKALVRECVNEVLAEKYLEHCVNETRKPTRRQRPLREATNTAAPKAIEKHSLRETIKSKLGMTDNDPMAYIFEDTDRKMQGVPQNGQDEPGNVSEESMKKIGIFDKDWSKLI